jgi:hypothetical protein
MAVAVAPVSPPPLVLTLAGIAANTVDGAVQRTAIIDSPSGVTFVKAGDRVATFTVTDITDTSVALVDPDGATRTLTLKP